MDTKTYIPVEAFLENDLDGFCKVINGHGGKMIYLLEILNKKIKINGKNCSVSDFFKLLGRKKFLVQERIVQHKDMNALNPSCINTLRVITVKTGQVVQPFSIFQRIGINGNYVDNGLQGNIIAGIQKETGKLMEYAITPDIKNFKIKKHPQTQTVFKDFKIPFYNQAIETTLSLHLLFQHFFMIGWDIGITPNGPIVIEANQVSDPYPIQLIYGGIKSSFLKLVTEYQNTKLS
jgi:hypothetical protein